MSASNQFNVGKDVSLDIIGPSGPLRFSIMTGFDAKQNTHPLESLGMDGINRFDEAQKGWSGSFSLDRSDGTVDKYFAQKEANYYNGVSNPAVSITETIAEIDGSVSQFRYTGVCLTYADAGKKSADNKISMSISFRASRRIQVA